MTWCPRATTSILAGVAALFLLGVAVSTPCLPQVAVARGVAEAEHVAPSGRRLFWSQEYLPSLYLNYYYRNPSSQEQRSWFSGMTVTESTKATFFAVQRTQFGYLGIQETLTTAGRLRQWLGLSLSSLASIPFYGLVIFSAWDESVGKCKVESVGDGAYHRRFGNEGTGCQIKLDTSWGNEHYGFVTTAARTGSGRILLTGYWHKGDESWKLVGSISVPDVGQQFGTGGIASFIEQYFSSIDENDLRMANFGPQYVETAQGEWVPIDGARFTMTDSDRQAHYVGEVTTDGAKFTMGLAGRSIPSIRSNTPSGTDLQLRAAPPPSSSPELQSFIRLRSAGSLPQGCRGDVAACGNTNHAMYSTLGMDSLIPNSWGMGLLEFLMLALIIAVAWTLCLCFRSLSQEKPAQEPIAIPLRPRLYLD